MTDPKRTVNADQEDDDNSSNITHLSNNTDATDTNLPQLGAPPQATNVPYSLDRLEHDLRRLQAKWGSVEQEIADRDEHIALLEGDIDSCHTQISALEKDAAAATAAKETLSDQLASALDEVAALEAKSVDVGSQLDARTAELESAHNSHEKLLGEKRQLERDLEEQRNSAGTELDRVSHLDAENVELRVHIQELQDYIDRRKSDWDDLNESLKEYEKTIKGMSSSIESHDAVLKEREKEKAALSVRIVELERELAKLTGQYAERESAQAVLQLALDEHSRELGGLNKESIRLHKDIEKLQKKLDRKDTTIASLRDSVKKRDSDLSALEKMLDGEKSANAELNIKLSSSNERVATLEAAQQQRDASSDELGMTIGELRERLRLSEPTIEKLESQVKDLEGSLQTNKATENDLRDQLTAANKELDAASSKATEYEIRAAELDAVVLEIQSSKKSVESELEAQRGLVLELERELHRKQENLDLLDRSAERLSAISSGIRDIDVQIDDHWLQHPDDVFEESKDLFEETNEVLLEPEELFDETEDLAEHVIVTEEDGIDRPITHPLNRKVTTIGRSRRNDIRLNNKYISRVHARIIIDGARATIEDAGSTNGFFVNSEHATSHTLSHGDVLAIGTSKLKYLHLSPE